MNYSGSFRRLGYLFSVWWKTGVSGVLWKIGVSVWWKIGVSVMCCGRLGYLCSIWWKTAVSVVYCGRLG